MNSTPIQLSILHQEGLPVSYLEASWNILRNMLNILPNQRKYIPRKIENGQIAANYWINQGIYRAQQQGRYQPFRGFYRQIHAEPITNGMNMCTMNTPSLHMIMVMRDSIYADGLNYCNGYSNGTGNTIVSVGLNSPYEVSLNEYCYILAHELGHKLGATDFSLRGNEIYNYPTMGTHCLTPGCLMNVVPDIQTQKRMARNHALLCAGCIRAIRQHLSR